jgi:hypothetical protein
MLQVGALAGVPMTPQKIEELMEVMNRVEVVQWFTRRRMRSRP